MLDESLSIEVRSCGVLVFRQQPTHSFLLMQHAKRWDLPKGHVDPGETDLETALRELVEETGITQQQIELDDQFRFSHQYMVRKKRYGDQPKRKELVIFMGELTESVEIQPTEHIGFQWFDWQPPHQIQEKTIDPLLSAVAEYWS